MSPIKTTDVFPLAIEKPLLVLPAEKIVEAPGVLPPTVVVPPESTCAPVRSSLACPLLLLVLVISIYFSTVVSVPTSETTIVDESELAKLVVPVWVASVCSKVEVFNVDWTLPEPFNSKAVLEYCVKGDPDEFNNVLPSVANIIFLLV